MRRCVLRSQSRQRPYSIFLVDYKKNRWVFKIRQTHSRFTLYMCMRMYFAYRIGEIVGAGAFPWHTHPLYKFQNKTRGFRLFFVCSRLFRKFRLSALAIAPVFDLNRAQPR